MQTRKTKQAGALQDHGAQALLRHHDARCAAYDRVRHVAVAWLWRLGAWLHAKLLLVAVLIGYHLWCGKLVTDFKHDRNRRSHVWYRWFNEFPVLILIAVVILVVVKPF
jgi:uncharacterized membrane protein